MVTVFRTPQLASTVMCSPGEANPPDGVAGLLLQDHVIAEEVGESNFGVGCEPSDEGGDEGEGVFHAWERVRSGRVVAIPRGGRK